MINLDLVNTKDMKKIENHSLDLQEFLDMDIPAKGSLMKTLLLNNKFKNGPEQYPVFKNLFMLGKLKFKECFVKGCRIETTEELKEIIGNSMFENPSRYSFSFVDGVNENISAVFNYYSQLMDDECLSILDQAAKRCRNSEDSAARFHRGIKKLLKQQKEGKLLALHLDKYK